MSDTVDRFRDWDAAYVLGALGQDDRRAFERHLAGCQECRAAVADLAGLPGILGKLPVDDAVSLLSMPDDAHLREQAHTPGLVQRLAVAAGRRRRRIRFGMLGAAIAVVALIAVGGIAFTAVQAPAITPVAMSQVTPGVMTASMQVSQKGWGTRFDWSCSYLGDSWSTAGERSYDLVVTDLAGQKTVVATWSAAGEKAGGLSASTGIRTADIRSVEIRLTGSNTALLRENL